MTSSEQEFYKYFNRVALESILLDDDILSEINNNILDYEEDIILETIELILEEIKSGNYIKKATDNLGILLNEMNKKCVNNKEKIEKLYNEYQSIKDIKTDEYVYMIEAFYKTMNSSYLKYLDYVSIDKEALDDSIRFDCVTIKTLIDKNYEILETELYIYSIRKFLLEFPEMFLDKNINKRALEILKKNININGSKRLIHKIKHIDKFMENNFNMIIYKQLYDIIVVQNLLDDHQLIQKNENVISKDIIETLHRYIDENAIRNEKNKQNAYEILNVYKDKIYDNLTPEEKKEFLEKHNEYIGRLNTMTTFNDNIIAYEAETRLYGFDKIKAILGKIDFDILFLQDLEVFNLFMFDEESYQEKINQLEHEEIYLSINKFINKGPSIFDDEIIYRRTIELLDAKNIETFKTKSKVKKIYRGY